MGTSALALVKPLSALVIAPKRAAVDWRLLGDLLQKIASEGDRDFLDWMAQRASFHLELIQSAKQLSPTE